MPPFRSDWALFLDVDGTLLEIAATPRAVHTDRADTKLIAALYEKADGALALVSGRSLATIDLLFAPLKLPAAGQHGVERRDARGRVQRPAFPADVLTRAADMIGAFAAKHAGLVFEHKGYSMALHYRLAPHLAGAAHAVVREACRAVGEGMEVQRGKMVAELKPAGHDKGKAIEAFMREKPFAGRIPVFLGDDLTDEHGFRVVERLGGHSIKIGPGATEAKWRLPHPAAARAWLGDWLARASA
ncbi:MAG TPA: trehalose-phosphatase [Burkholderiales bacterium]|nr:trehalose-phosphatase [Burkholderiales bacterium]